MSIPFVTVIIPNYNHSPYLKERIDSVLEQSYSSFEVIMMDDCSTDNSREIIEQYRDHPKVAQIVYNSQNSGSTFKQWNAGIEMASSELIWIAESDDVAHSDLLASLVIPMQNKDVVLSYCQSLRINSHGESIGNWLFQTEDLDKNLFKTNFEMDGRDFIHRFLLYKNVIPNASAVVFRKDTYLQAGGADPEIRYCSDWLTWLKMLTYGKIYYHASMLNRFRYHESSVIASSGAMVTFWKKYDIIMRKAYNVFLKNRSESIGPVVKKNLLLLRKECRKEFKFLWRRKAYYGSLTFLKMAAFTRR